MSLPNSFGIVGIGFGSDGMLYGLDINRPAANLFRIDVATADGTLIGTLDRSAFSATADAAGTMYVFSGDSDTVLYNLSPPSTTTTVVTTLGSTFSGLAAVNADGTQFFTGSNAPVTGDTTLFSVDTATGAVTQIGSVGFSIDFGLFVDGVLYGFENETSTIVAIDTVTGFGTKVATYSLPNEDSLDAAAYFAPQLVSVPEPSSLAMAGVAGIGLIGYGARRRKRA
jgi:hypothetical protein